MINDNSEVKMFNYESNFLFFYLLTSIYPFVVSILLLEQGDDTIYYSNSTTTSQCQSNTLFYSVANIVVFSLKVYGLIYWFLRDMFQECLERYNKKRNIVAGEGRFNFGMECCLLCPFHVEWIPYYSRFTNVIIRIVAQVLLLGVLALYIGSQVFILFSGCDWTYLYSILTITAGSYELIILVIWIMVINVFSDKQVDKEPDRQPTR
jgi:hypothetical protein